MEKGTIFTMLDCLDHTKRRMNRLLLVLIYFVCHPMLSLGGKLSKKACQCCSSVSYYLTSHSAGLQNTLDVCRRCEFIQIIRAFYSLPPEPRIGYLGA